MGIRIGIDTGGTFTDLIAVDTARGTWHLSKVPSRPTDPVATITSALDDAGVDPAEVELVVVGTTLGINAVLTRRGARVVYLTTDGFQDIPFIQRINRKHHYDFTWKKPTPLAHRPDCIGAHERLDEEGRVIEPIDLERLEREVAARIAAGEPPAIAVCYLFSYLNPAHEIATRDRLAARFPDVPVSLSHEIAPIWREYERGSTAIVDAYLKPLVEQYVDGVSTALADRGVTSPWGLLKSNGGQAIAAEARGRPAHLLLSGIAGGGIGAAHFARAAGADRGIMVDMGGTSADVCLIVDGEPLYSSDFEIEFGFPVSVPSISTRTIGAGGGSIGWVDPGGFLQVGPQSAGAQPGPACYGQGGEDATITDANVRLGRLDPGYFLGGSMPLDGSLSSAALARLGTRTGMDEVDVASAMLRVTNENMANAIRIVTVEQGIDPRDFALVAFGGAGPTHGCEIADAIGMSRVVVPPHPGLGSAFGALSAQPRVDTVKSVYLTDDRTTSGEIDALFSAAEERSLEDFAAQGGESPEIRRSLAMRYQGQNYEQEVPVPNGTIDDAALAGVYAEYGRLYEGFYGYRLDGIPVELVRLTVVVSAAPPSLPGLAPEVGDDDAPQRQREVFFPGHGFVSTAVVHRDRLLPGTELAGPVVVESMDSTVVVPPGWGLSSLDSGVLDLVREGK